MLISIKKIFNVEFDKLTITITRATTGFNKIPVPKFYIKTMVELDDHVTENLAKEKSTKKKNNNSKAMNNLKTKLKKLSKQFEESINAYKKVYSFSTNFFCNVVILIKMNIGF